jgi:hypothetical protein
MGIQEYLDYMARKERKKFFDKSAQITLGELISGI